MWLGRGDRSTKNSTFSVARAVASDAKPPPAGAPKKALAFLSLLLVGYAVSVYFRQLRSPAAPPLVNPASASALVNSAEPDVAPVRANMTVRQPLSPFRFKEIA